MLDLLDGMLTDETDFSTEASGSGRENWTAQECDGCGRAKADVDLWATNSETGEELWLCEACGDW